MIIIHDINFYYIKVQFACFTENLLTRGTIRWIKHIAEEDSRLSPRLQSPTTASEFLYILDSL